DAVREHVLERPRVRSVGIEPNRQILHQWQHPAGARELAIELVLQPCMKTYAAGELAILREAPHARAIGTAIRGWPGVPPAVEPFGQRTERGVFVQCRSLLGEERLERLVAPAPNPRPDLFEGSQLPLENAIAVDDAVAVERPGV